MCWRARGALRLKIVCSHKIFCSYKICLEIWSGLENDICEQKGVCDCFSEYSAIQDSYCSSVGNTVGHRYILANADGHRYILADADGHRYRLKNSLSDGIADVDAFARLFGCGQRVIKLFVVSVFVKLRKQLAVWLS